MSPFNSLRLHGCLNAALKISNADLGPSMVLSKKDYLDASIYRLIFLHDKTNILADPQLLRELPLIGASNWTVVIISSRGRTGD
jgi:hypothetical protein